MASELGCRGWNFHVFALGADTCTMCRKSRAQLAAERPAPIDHRARIARRRTRRPGAAS